MCSKKRTKKKYTPHIEVLYREHIDKIRQNRAIFCTHFTCFQFSNIATRTWTNACHNCELYRRCLFVSLLIPPSCQSIQKQKNRWFELRDVFPPLTCDDFVDGIRYIDQYVGIGYWKCDTHSSCRVFECLHLLLTACKKHRWHTINKINGYIVCAVMRGWPLCKFFAF